MEIVVIFYGHLVNLCPFRTHILWLIGTFLRFFVRCTKKNLATLLLPRGQFF
jgi:hypothetical protein